MTEERCERTDLIKDQCAHCRGHDHPEQDYIGSHPPLGTTVLARFEARCARYVEHRIEPGDVIRKADEGWLCTDCTRDEG